MIPPLAALLRYHENAHSGAEATSYERRESTRLLTALNARLQAKYNAATSRYGSGAVVEINRNTCTGCHMRLPANPRELAEDVYQCDHCGRLLYDPDAAYDLSVG